MDTLDAFTEENLKYWEENDVMNPEEAGFLRGFNGNKVEV